jgi:membrane associated rhomboid family serine protease
LNLNHILLFLAIVSPLLVLARGWRPSQAYHGWRFAAVIVLSVTAVAWFLWSDVSGFVGGAAWFLLLFLPAIGLRKVTQFAARGDYQSAGRLGAALQILHPTAELREQVRLFRHLKSNPPRRNAFSSVPTHNENVPATWASRFRTAPAVFVVILVTVLVFVFQIWFGGLKDPDALHRIGALEPDAVVTQGEYWRLLTALFLHGNYLHLAFNLFALYFLGRPLESSIGTIRFLVCYLISGLASGAGVIGLNRMGLVRDAQLIGASGCILGVVGAWAGFLLRHHHAPFAKQQLANIGLIVVIQIAFDLSTPEVSMAAHMCGLFAGFFLGLILAPKAVVGGVDPGA